MSEIATESNKDLMAERLPAVTAAIRPELFASPLAAAIERRLVIVFLLVFVMIGFGLRTAELGSESLGEDELNKLQTANEYRENGLSGKNGEHPFLMKGLQTASIVVAEKINGSSFETVGITRTVSEEAALRFPVAVFGTLTIVMLYLLIAALFGRLTGLFAACLWAVEPMAVGFDRVAKEDSLVLFFFLATNYFWVRAQSAAELGDAKWPRFAWAAAVSFAGLMASKYYPHLLAVPAAYYIIFQYIKATKWRMESRRWLTFIFVMGMAFLVFNPTILLPDTWREMLKFGSEKRIGHDSYEFMGEQYRNQMTAWLSGVPWTFYYVFIGVKTSLTTLILMFAGLPLLLRRRMGDGRFLLFFWGFMWFLPFTFLGGKFTRYFTLVEPLLLIAAAVTCVFFIEKLAVKLSAPKLRAAFIAIVLVAVTALPLYNSAGWSPHYRMFTNVIGGGDAAAGNYFPHDEFYDADTHEVMSFIATNAPQNSTIACETPGLFEHYAQRAGRDDLRIISLSDADDVASLRPGDFVADARGRRYFSNRDLVRYLADRGELIHTSTINGIASAYLYRLNANDVNELTRKSREPSIRN